MRPGANDSTTPVGRRAAALIRPLESPQSDERRHCPGETILVVGAGADRCGGPPPASGRLGGPLDEFGGAGLVRPVGGVC